MASFEMIEEWLVHALIENDQLGVNQLVERWRSLVWVKGSTEVFPIKTDSEEHLQIEFRPKLMNDGGLLIALSEATDLKASDTLVRDDRGSLSEINRRMDVLLSIVSDILRLWGNDQDAETLNVTVSRIDALALLLTHTTEEEHFASVNFGQYTSCLVKELIEIAPNYSDPCVHLNYGIQLGGDSLGRVPRIEKKEIFMPYSLAMPLALICNEILRNIFIHACQDRDEVNIKISIILKEDESGGELLFSHDGVPLPSDYDLNRDAGNGLKIVRSLVTRIGGKLKMNCGPLTEFNVEFCFSENR